MPMEDMTISASTEALPEESAADAAASEEPVTGTEVTEDTAAADQEPGSVDDSVKVIYLMPDDSAYSSFDPSTSDQLTVSAGDAGGGAPYSTGIVAESVDYSEFLEQVLMNQETLIEQNARLQDQNEACISFLAIIVVVGLLNYVYKFFKMFF